MAPGPCCRLPIRVTPRSDRARIQWDGSKLHVWVTAPPAEGRANEAVLRLVARELDLAFSKLSIVRGGHGREKLVEIVGLDLDQAIQRLLD